MTLTPGPWHWVDSDNDQPMTENTWIASLRTVEEFQSEYSRWSLPKFIVNTDGGKGDMSAEDAALIAAAPDLLEALIETQKLACGDWCNPGKHTPECDRATAAIARARGESA